MSKRIKYNVPITGAGGKRIKRIEKREGYVALLKVAPDLPPNRFVLQLDFIKRRIDALVDYRTGMVFGRFSHLPPGGTARDKARAMIDQRVSVYGLDRVLKVLATPPTLNV